MRSRYSAHVLGNLDYLGSTWHPDFRPADLGIDAGIRLIGLDIIAQDQQGRRATVEFEARLLAAGSVDALHERSSFVREQEQWFYTEGEMLAPSFAAWKPGRNQNCPCGSGLKFKRCCGSA